MNQANGLFVENKLSKKPTKNLTSGVTMFSYLKQENVCSVKSRERAFSYFGSGEVP